MSTILKKSTIGGLCGIAVGILFRLYFTGLDSDIPFWSMVISTVGAFAIGFFIVFCLRRQEQQESDEGDYGV